MNSRPVFPLPYLSRGSGSIPLAEIGVSIVKSCKDNGLSDRTAYLYVCWARRYVMHHQCRHPADMGEQEVRDFILQLVLNKRKAASTQNQALQALCFLYEHVLHQSLPPSLTHSLRAKCPQRLPAILKHDEIITFIDRLTGSSRLVAILQYGSGLRLMEALQLKIKDLSFDTKKIIIGTRQVPVSIKVIELLNDQIRERRAQISGLVDIRQQLLFVGNRRKNSQGTLVWPSLHPLVIQRAYRSTEMGITSCSLRQAFGIHLIDHGMNILLVKEILGQKDIHSTMRYQKASSGWISGIISPLDFLEFPRPARVT